MIKRIVLNKPKSIVVFIFKKSIKSNNLRTIEAFTKDKTLIKVKKYAKLLKNSFFMVSL